MAMMKTLVFGYALAAAAVLGAEENVLELAAGEGDNKSSTSTTVFLPTNCTVRLTGDAGGGLFPLYARLCSTNGDFTVDASALTNCTGIRWYGHVRAQAGWGDRPDGRIYVKGTDRIVFGDAVCHDYASTQQGYLGADFVFQDASGNALENPTVIFTNSLTLVRAPESYTYQVATNAFVWLYLSGFAPEKDGVTELEHYNLGLVDGDAVGTDCIRVPENRRFVVRACKVNWEDDKTLFYRWVGKSLDDWPHRVELAGGTFLLPNNSSFSMTGGITGYGSIQYTGGAATTFGDSCFTGKVTVTGAKLIFNGSFEQSPTNQIVFSNTSRGRLHLKPAARADGTTCGWLGDVSGVNATNNALVVQASQTLYVQSLSGKIGIEGSVTTSAAVVSNVAAETEIRLQDGVQLTLAKAESVPTLTLAKANGTDTWKVSGPTSGTPIALEVVSEAAAPNLVLDGKVNLVSVPDNLASVTFAAHADVDCALPPNCLIRSQGGTWRNDPARRWQDKITLWCDASATRTLSDGTVTNTFAYISELPGFTDSYSTTRSDGSPYLLKWYDCRTNQTTYCFGNKRFSKASEITQSSYYDVFPCLAQDDGRTFVNMTQSGSAHMNIFNLESTANDAKKVLLPSAYAIVVFGSQGGGGAAVLGNQDGAFARGLTGRNAKTTVSDYPVFTNAFETCIDGTAVDPTQAHFNGGWQIVSFNTAGNAVQGIGFDCNGTDGAPTRRGYTRYAEVMLFAECPTEFERKQIEEYLAAKWSVAISHTNTIASVEVHGSGDTVLHQKTAFTGSLAGRVDLNGQCLELADGRVPFTEAELPSENRILWFDPSCTGSVIMSSDAAKPLEVDAVMPRDANGAVTNRSGNVRYYLQSAIKADGKTDRRAHVSDGSRGGTAARWLDFTDFYADGVPNNLMIQQLPYRTPLELYTESSWYSVNYKTAFLVLDTSLGGGTPLCHYAGAGSGDIYYRGKAPSVNTPIWNAKCMPIITNGCVWLDGVAVNANERGFSGRPELMSFQPADEGGTSGSDTSVKALACLSTNPNQEMLGEVLFYSTKLDETTRTGIEAYLMHKWLGRLPDGFVDFRNLTIAGASGTVVIPNVAHAPRFADDFSGTVACGNALDFTITAMTANALVAPQASFDFPATVTVNIAFADRPTTGSVLLLSGALAQPVAFEVGTVTGVVHPPLTRLVYSATEKTLRLTILERGTLLTIR